MITITRARHRIVATMNRVHGEYNGMHTLTPPLGRAQSARSLIQYHPIDLRFKSCESVGLVNSDVPTHARSKRIELPLQSHQSTRSKGSPSRKHPFVVLTAPTSQLAVGPLGKPSGWHNARLGTTCTRCQSFSVRAFQKSNLCFSSKG